MDMRSWKKYTIIYLTIILAPVSLYGQKVKELDSLMYNGRYFEAKELYRHIRDILNPSTDLFYKYRMAQFMDKKDSVTIYLEQILSDYPDMFGVQTIDVYSILMDTYTTLRNYEKGMFTYQRMTKHLKENPYGIEKEMLTRWQERTEDRLYYLKQAVSQPPITLKRSHTHDSVKIIGDLRPICTVKYNGVSLRTVLDTGTQPYCVMSKKRAEQIGIKYNTSKFNQESLNKAISTDHAIIDSMAIGNLILYNIPVDLYEDNITSHLSDSVKNNPEETALADSSHTNAFLPTIGLPLLKLIGKLRIDYEKKQMTFPDTDTNHLPKEPNLFIYNRNLYTQLKINGKDFTSYLGTGSDTYIDIDTIFYKRYKTHIPIDTITEKPPYDFAMLHQVWNNIPYQLPDKPILTFNDNLLHPSTKRLVKIDPIRLMWPEEVFDGVIGYPFFKRIGKKVLLDLENMRLDAEE